MKCEVCGMEFKPFKENRYTAIEDAAPIFRLTKMYDCFDCPCCGCQVVAKERFNSITAESEKENKNV